AGNTFASRKNGPAVICRKSRISWNASRPDGSRFRISRWPLRRSRSTTPAIGPPRRAVASGCEVREHLPIAWNHDQASWLETRHGHDPHHEGPILDLILRAAYAASRRMEPPTGKRPKA